MSTVVVLIDILYTLFIPVYITYKMEFNKSIPVNISLATGGYPATITLDMLEIGLLQITRISNLEHV